jgi:hypothetical protein
MWNFEDAITILLVGLDWALSFLSSGSKLQATEKSSASVHSLSIAPRPSVIQFAQTASCRLRAKFVPCST